MNDLSQPAKSRLLLANESDGSFDYREVEPMTIRKRFFAMTAVVSPRRRSVIVSGGRQSDWTLLQRVERLYLTDEGDKI